MPDSLTIVPATRRDGRNIRATRTREAIIRAVRERMRAGDFRPSIAAVAEAADVATRSVFTHFHDVESMHRAALDMPTRRAIVALVLPDDHPLPPPLEIDCIVFAAVYGRAVPQTSPVE